MSASASAPPPSASTSSARPSPCSPGSVADRRVAYGVRPWSRGARSTSGTPSSTAARLTRRYRTGSSSLRSSAEQHDRRGAVAGRRSSRSGRPSTTSAGRPSPSWASTLSVPITPLAKPGPHVRVLVGAARAAEHARSTPGRAASSASRERRRPRRRAPPATSTRRARRPCGPSGRGRAARECTTSKPKRPLSHSQPWFTGSESTPSRRTSRFDDDCSAPRHCTAHVVQRVSTALEVPRPGLEAVRRRGERADRADLHGVAREVRVERLVREGEDLRAVAAVDEVDERVAGDLVGEARAAAALDAALAVEQHEVAEIGIGFSQCRFSSTKRDSPGPNASVWSCSGHSPPRSHTGQSSGWLMSRNSSTPSCDLSSPRRTACARPCRRRPASCTQAGSPRTPSTSTRHMRHMPTGFMRSCQQKRGM